MKLKASQVLIIVFGSSFVVSALFSLDALFMYTVFCFILQVTDPFARRVKTEEKRKSTYLCSFHAVPCKFVIRTYKKMLFLQAECAHSYFRQWLLIFSYSICLVGSLKYI